MKKRRVGPFSFGAAVLARYVVAVYISLIYPQGASGKQIGVLCVFVAFVLLSLHCFPPGRATPAFSPPFSELDRMQCLRFRTKEKNQR